MASIVATLDAMESEGIVENARAIGETEIAPALAELAERHAVIGEVRGEGVFWAIELVADRDTRVPLPAAAMGRIKSGLVARGLLPFIQDNRIHVVPPCVVTVEDVAEAMPIYDEVLSTALEGEG
jgi:taurine--2-oxoglutarate transaminase